MAEGTCAHIEAITTVKRAKHCGALSCYQKKRAASQNYPV
jgi:hypothetical protein